MPRMMCRAAGLVVAAVVAAGCSQRPHAPALQDELVFHQQQEGFRFLPPQGWLQHARGIVPPGKADTERLVVEYLCPTSVYPASLAVSRIDLPESTPLDAFVQGQSFGADKWRKVSAPESIVVNGAPAVRMTFAAGKGVEMRREVTVFRRGERVYFFNGIFAAADLQARDEVRRAAASVLWRS